MARKTPINGYVIYDGPSMLDGVTPVVMIATGFAEASDNTKTGNMIQTWILLKDVHPNNAVNSGEDVAICGDCVHRGRLMWDQEKLKRRVTGRTCYVKIFQAPSNIWKAYKRGLYPEMSPYDIPEMFQGRTVRFGSYAEPTAIPYNIINSIGLSASFITGYTHQWKNCDGRFKKWVMASAESNEERVDAKSLGYRTFRVRADFDDVDKFEIKCPAAKEMGHKTVCADCKACGGLSSKANADVSIMAHGDAVKQMHFKKLIEKRAA